MALSMANCMAIVSKANDKEKATTRKRLQWGMVGSAGSPQVTITPASLSLVPAVARYSLETVSWPAGMMADLETVGARSPSGNTLRFPLGALGHSRSV